MRSDEDDDGTVVVLLLLIIIFLLHGVDYFAYESFAIVLVLVVLMVLKSIVIRLKQSKERYFFQMIKTKNGRMGVTRLPHIVLSFLILMSVEVSPSVRIAESIETKYPLLNNTLCPLPFFNDYS